MINHADSPRRCQNRMPFQYYFPQNNPTGYRFLQNLSEVNFNFNASLHPICNLYHITELTFGLRFRIYADIKNDDKKNVIHEAKMKTTAKCNSP
ncbi:hypothetical protein T4C_5092 [Trichinella pseudospiralis]|uniref:Uncharacterized protein n=1 Tax=Trichinella pseudospiralis TaxID=6337 RepID=A0A0V1JQ17_TRIPS|nr:hypothetical protein T4C_5092 [Trichinella pseudospiralis]